METGRWTRGCTHLCVGWRLGLARVLHMHAGISPCMSEGRDSLLCVNSPRWRACFLSWPQPGSLSLCSELGLGGCQPVAGDWQEGRLPCAQIQLQSQLLLVETAETRKLQSWVPGPRRRWCSRWLPRPTPPSWVTFLLSLSFLLFFLHFFSTLSLLFSLTMFGPELAA